MNTHISILFCLLLIGGNNALDTQCAEKHIKKRVKKLEKEGWMALPSQDLKEMIRDCCEKEVQNQFLVEGTYTGSTLSIAKLQSMEVAKLTMAMEVESDTMQSIKIEPVLTMFKMLPNGQYECSTTIILLKP